MLITENKRLFGGYVAFNRIHCTKLLRVLQDPIKPASFKILLEQIREASVIAGPERVMGDSLLHTILRHLEPHDMNLVLVRIHLGLQSDVVPFMTLLPRPGCLGRFFDNCEQK